MDLILSEDATIHLNGRDVFIKKGSAVSVERNKSLFQIDEEFKLYTNNGIILVESGDVIEVNGNGEHNIINNCEFISEGRRFALESGDKINVIEEGFWEGFKSGFTGRDYQSEALGEVINGLLEISDLINAVSSRYEAQNPNQPNPYNKILESDEINFIGEIGHHIRKGVPKSKAVKNAMIIHDISDPVEVINRIRDAVAEIGNKKLAAEIERITPKGYLGKFSQAWRNMIGKAGTAGKFAKDEISPGVVILGYDEDGNKYRMRGTSPTRDAYGPIGEQTSSRWEEVTDGVFKKAGGKETIRIYQRAPKSQEPESEEPVAPETPASEAGKIAPKATQNAWETIKSVAKNLGITDKPVKSQVDKISEVTGIDREQVMKIYRFFTDKPSKKQTSENVEERAGRVKQQEKKRKPKQSVGKR